MLLDSSLLLVLGDLSRLRFGFFFAALHSSSPSVELLPDRLLLALASLDLFLPRLPRVDRSLAGLVSLVFFFLVFSRSSSARLFLPFFLSFLFFFVAGLRLQYYTDFESGKRNQFCFLHIFLAPGRRRTKEKKTNTQVWFSIGSGIKSVLILKYRQEKFFLRVHLSARLSIIRVTV